MTDETGLQWWIIKDFFYIIPNSLLFIDKKKISAQASILIKDTMKQTFWIEEGKRNSCFFKEQLENRIKERECNENERKLNESSKYARRHSNGTFIRWGNPQNYIWRRSKWFEHLRSCQQAGPSRYGSMSPFEGEASRCCCKRIQHQCWYFAS